MKPIKKDELFGHVSEFLKTRGIELKEGSYAQGIQKGCSLLTDSINLSQKGLKQAKTQFDKQWDDMRQAIHEHTAPNPTAEAKPSSKAPPKKAPARKQGKSTKR